MGSNIIIMSNVYSSNGFPNSKRDTTMCVDSMQETFKGKAWGYWQHKKKWNQNGSYDNKSLGAKGRFKVPCME